jgi:hypothetical protein
MAATCFKFLTLYDISSYLTAKSIDEVKYRHPGDSEEGRRQIADMDAHIKASVAWEEKYGNDPAAIEAELERSLAQTREKFTRRTQVYSLALRRHVPITSPTSSPISPKDDMAPKLESL